MINKQLQELNFYLWLCISLRLVLMDYNLELFVSSKVFTNLIFNLSDSNWKSHDKSRCLCIWSSFDGNHYGSKSSGRHHARRAISFGHMVPKGLDQQRKHPKGDWSSSQPRRGDHGEHIQGGRVGRSLHSSRASPETRHGPRCEHPRPSRGAMETFEPTRGRNVRDRFAHEPTSGSSKMASQWRNIDNVQWHILLANQYEHPFETLRICRHFWLHGLQMIERKRKPKKSSKGKKKRLLKSCLI